MAIKLVLDSASDISKEEAAALGGVMLPLNVYFGDVGYLDNVTISHSEFFDKLESSGIFPTTSQVPPYDYERAFSEIIEAGDEALCLTVSAKLSGCYQSAIIAQEKFGDKVRVVDTLNVSLGIRILAQLAKFFIDRELPLDKVRDILEEEKHNIRLIAKLDTLEYLKKGGRISRTVAFAGGLLGIKLLVTLSPEGEVVLLGKRRGARNANAMLTKMIADEGGINFDYPFCVAYSGNSRAEIDEYLDDNKNLYTSHTRNLPVATIGAAIGSHVGPGAIAATFFVNKK